MTDTAGMTVDWPAIRRQLRKNGDSFVHVLAAVDGIEGAPPAMLASTRLAVELANAAMTDAADQEIVWAADPVSSPAGPIVYVKWPGDEEAQTHEWLDHLAAALTSRGHSGTIKAARYAELPYDLGNSVAPHPAAYLGYTLTNPLAPLSGHDWLLTDEKAKDVISDATSWVTGEGDSFYFTERAFQIQVEPGDVGPLLHQAMLRAGHATTTATSRATKAARQVGLAKGGQVVFDILGTTIDWQGELPRLRARLLRDPASLDIGIIRSSRGLVFSWYSIVDSPTAIPHLPNAVAWELNRHMWSEFVPDAHAVQVLTPAHLARAADLSRWAVTKLDGDRWLVETRDLDGWFAEDGKVTEDVLAQARHDFGAMIITTEDIEDDPHGWLGGPYPPGRA